MASQSAGSDAAVETDLERCQRLVAEGNARLQTKIALIAERDREGDTCAASFARRGLLEILSYVRLAEQQLDLERAKAWKGSR